MRRRSFVLFVFVLTMAGGFRCHDNNPPAAQTPPASRTAALVQRTEVIDKALAGAVDRARLETDAQLEGESVDSRIRVETFSAALKKNAQPSFEKEIASLPIDARA